MSNTTKNFGIPKPPESWADLHPGKGLPECVNEALDFIDGVIQFHQRKVTLTAAQIKTLAAAPVELIPAPGANKYIAPLAIAISYAPGLVAFVDHSSGIGPWYDDGTVLELDAVLPESGSTVHHDFAFASPLYAFLTSTTPAVYFGPVLPVQASPASTILNKAIKLFNVNGPGTDLTAGDGTLTIAVHYAIVDIS